MRYLWWKKIGRISLNQPVDNLIFLKYVNEEKGNIHHIFEKTILPIFPVLTRNITQNEQIKKEFIKFVSFKNHPTQ